MDQTLTLRLMNIHEEGPFCLQLMCCGVREKGWAVFKDTRWFEEYGAIDETKGLRPGYGSIVVLNCFLTVMVHWCVYVD